MALHPRRRSFDFTGDFTNALRENSLGRFFDASALKEGDPMRQTDLAGADGSSFDDLSHQTSPML